MNRTNIPTAQGLMEAALQHLQAAIELLDQAEAPGEVAANADLARCQLEKALRSPGAGALKGPGAGYESLGAVRPS